MRALRGGRGWLLSDTSERLVSRMRIDNYSKTLDDGKARVSARVTWEDCDRPPREIHFTTEEEFEKDLHPEPNAFLIGAILPAMRHGEKRVRLEGRACPHLRNGLQTVMKQLRAWYGDERHDPVATEPTQGFHPPLPAPVARASCFFSGGVDSMATLRCNRLDYPLDHPGSIRDGFFIQGYDFGAYESLDPNHEHFEQTRDLLREFGREIGVVCIPVQTNLRHLDENDAFFHAEGFGAALAAIPHLFARRVTAARIPSSGDVGSTYQMGSHPLLDLHYSSAALEIVHDGARFTRFEKVRLVADWAPALRRLRACFDAFRQDLNCGRCEKCLRTMAALLVLGKLRDCPTYPLDDLTPEHLQMLDASVPKSHPKARREAYRVVYRQITKGNVAYWRELADVLRECGRCDLARVAAAKVAEYDARRRSPHPHRWRAALKRFDQRFLKGFLSSLRT